MHQTEVRKLIAQVETDLAIVTAAGQPKSTDALRDSWEALTKHLNVGPAPQTRACPSCKAEIMRAATRCMHCWTKSDPPE